ncbi:flagellar motor-associated protein FliL [Arcobacter venerupis]|uniref:Flagellar protein FliL n=1 Tax=Arcobacter venerupis TaxID=1054033 RepID=A0AAE7E2P2_9BACT|nr:flagellar basal body-associated FliL family protein [Arcobacter venerupis]QKF65920.1 flagellar motor-associated protein FliL [Arcobacter venerupis]RWS49279.1 flagellar basal body protein FliL [Arcobacter venerupis]
MADDNQESKNSGGGKGLMIVLIALVVVLIVAVIGGGYFLYSQGALGNSNAAGQEEIKKDESSEKPDSYKADINDLVLNLTDSKGKEKLMKLSFSVKSIEPTIAAITEQYKAEIIDVVISQVSSRSSEELLTVGGKNLLKDELLQDINTVINEATKSNSDIAKDSIKQILFTTFVIK